MASTALKALEVWALAVAALRCVLLRCWPPTTKVATSGRTTGAPAVVTITARCLPGRASAKARGAPMLPAGASRSRAHSCARWRKACLWLRRLPVVAMDLSTEQRLGGALTELRDRAAEIATYLAQTRCCCLPQGPACTVQTQIVATGKHQCIGEERATLSTSCWRWGQRKGSSTSDHAP